MAKNQIKQKGGRNALMGISFTTSERELIQSEAKRLGLSQADYIILAVNHLMKLQGEQS